MRPRLVGLLAIALLVSAAYWPTLSNGFPYDDSHVAQADRPQLGRNQMVAELRPISTYFTTEYWRGAGAQAVQSSPLYRPVTVYSIALTHALWPGDGTLLGEAFPQHFVNLLLHLLATTLVFYLALRFCDRTIPALFGAAAFGLSAVHTEAVATIVGRADLLACALGALAMLTIPATPRPGAQPWLRVALASGLLFLAFCSKESALAWWPFAICLRVASNMRSGSTRLLDSAWLPLVAGAPAFVLWWYLRDLTIAPLDAPGLVGYAANPLQYVSLWQRCLASFAIQGYAIGSIVAPVNLSCDYGAAVFPFAEPGYPFGLVGVCYLGLWLAVLALGVYAVTRRSAPAFLAAAATLGFGVITSNTLHVIGSIHADRFTYLPSLGLAWFALWSLRIPRFFTAATLGIGLWCVANGVAAHQRALDYRDTETLFLADVARQPDALNLRLQAAAIEQRRGNSKGWRAHLEAALRLRPQWARPLIEMAAGKTLLAHQTAPPKDPDRSRFIVAELQSAEALLRRAAQAKIRSTDDNKRLSLNLGAILIQLGKTHEADRCFSAILAANQDDIELRHKVLINAASGLSDQQFLTILEAGEQRHPDSAWFKMHRGLRSARQSRWSTAREQLEHALPSIQAPDDRVYQAWLALASVRIRAGDEAAGRELFKSIADNPRFPAPVRKQAADHATR